jgi:hypothetical protein
VRINFPFCGACWVLNLDGVFITPPWVLLRRFNGLLVSLTFLAAGVRLKLRMPCPKYLTQALSQRPIGFHDCV